MVRERFTGEIPLDEFGWVAANAAWIGQRLEKPLAHPAHATSSLAAATFVAQGTATEPEPFRSDLRPLCDQRLLVNSMWLCRYNNMEYHIRTPAFPRD